MSKDITRRQEDFCLKYYELGNASEAARQAGYSGKTTTYQLLQNPKIQERLKDLKELEEEVIKKIENSAVMGVLERKIRLTEIARAKLTDFMELGQDGSWVNIGPETPYAGAIQEIHSRTEYDKDGSKPTVHTSVKLHDPMKAIDLMNKMEKLYSDGYQDNRVIKQLNIYVIDGETRDLIELVGDRTKYLNGYQDDKSIQGDSESVGGRKEGDTP